jgi:hypothetical protein
MDLVIVVSLLSLLAFSALIWWWTSARRSNGPAIKARNELDALDTVAAWPPQATCILSAPERRAYTSLRQALPEHIILAQVPLSRFMKVPGRRPYSEWLRRVGFMSIDLLVCDAESQIVGAIDIRSSASVDNPRTQKRHARMDRVLEAAGIPVHVWYDDAIPNPQAAQAQILSKIKVKPVRAARPKPVPVAAPVLATGAAAALADTTVVTKAAPASPDALAASKQQLEQLLAEEYEDAPSDNRDPPPSTWFHDLDDEAVPSNRGSGHHAEDDPLTGKRISLWR